MYDLWKILKDDLSNETSSDATSMKKIEELLKEQKLQCFEHIEKMDHERTPVKTKNLVVKAQRKANLEEIEIIIQVFNHWYANQRRWAKPFHF